MNLSQTMLESLRSTGTWARFIGVVSYVGLGFLVLGTVIIGVAGVAQLGTPQGIGMLVGAIVCAILTVIGFMFVSRLWGFATYCTTAANSGSTDDLARAQENSYRYWRFYGILMIVLLSIVVLAIPVAIIGGIAAAAASR